MKTKELVLLSVFMLLNLYANSQDRSPQIIYAQKVIREDRMFEQMFFYKKGVLILTKDSLIFKCKNERLAEFNFSIPYSDIKTVRPFYGFLIPNRINIRTKDGESYRLFTYKKRNIIRITRERMSNA